MRVRVPQLLVFWGLMALIFPHFLLVSMNTPMFGIVLFYIVGWIVSVLILALFHFYYGAPKGELDYDEDLTQNKLWFIVGGFIGVLVTSMILVSQFAKSAIWVPMLRSTLQVGGLQLSSVFQDVLFQISLVANSEQTMQLAGHMVFFRWLEGKDKRIQQAVSIGVPVGVWSLFHAYLAGFTPILLIMAFISGVIMYYVSYHPKGKAILVGILIHAMFNIVVLFQSGG